MNRVRPYIPLIGFVVPTVIVGYGVVIPRSCIAGINELTIGFGTTILGVIFTYIAGQRAVMPSCAARTPPLRVRILRALNRQAAAPSGWFGRILGLIWRREHARLNAEVLDLLEVRDGHRVLEVGSGPGEALAEAARRAQKSFNSRPTTRLEDQPRQAEEGPPCFGRSLNRSRMPSRGRRQISAEICPASPLNEYRKYALGPQPNSSRPIQTANRETKLFASIAADE